MIIIVNGYCHNAVPSPTIEKVYHVLVERYGVDNVLIDCPATPLEQWLKPSTTFVMIFDQAGWDREQLVQLSAEGLMARLPEGTPYREAIANKLLSWLEDQELITPADTFQWKSGVQLQDIVAKLYHLPTPGYWKAEYGDLNGRILRQLFTESSSAYDDLDSPLVRLKQSLLFPGFGKLPPNLYVFVDCPQKLVRPIYHSYPRTIITGSDLAERLSIIPKPEESDQAPACVLEALIHFFSAMGEVRVPCCQEENHLTAQLILKDGWIKGKRWPHFVYHCDQDPIDLEIGGLHFRYSVERGFSNSPGGQFPCSAQDWWCSVGETLVHFCKLQRD